MGQQDHGSTSPYLEQRIEILQSYRLKYHSNILVELRKSTTFLLGWIGLSHHPTLLFMVVIFFVSKKSPKFRCAFNCHFEPSHSRTFTKRGSFDIIPSFPNFCTFTNINRPRGHTSSITKETIMEMIVYLVDDPWTFCSNYRDTRRIIYSHKLNISNNDGNTYGIYIYNYIYIYIDNILWVLNINNDSL